MTRSTRDLTPPARPRSLRAFGTLTVVLIVCASVACGKKGPPLAPFVRVPALVTTVTPQRVGNDVYVSFAVPETNVDGQKPADIASVEVYAVTADRPPATEKQRELATLVATLPVRPLLPDLPIPVNGSAPPPLPLPPGVDRGAAVAIREPLTAEARVAVELPLEKPVVAIDAPIEEPVERLGPLVAPEATQLPRRHYFVVSKSPRGRESIPSTPVSVPLEAGSSAPGQPEVTHTATSLAVTWAPSPDARTSTFYVAPALKPVTLANATPANVTPEMPPPPAPLTAKSLGFTTQATTYHLYDVSASARPEAGELRRDLAEGGTPIDNPYAIALPKPITPAPIPATEWAVPGVVFGVERCFEVRPVDQVFGAIVIGPASPRTCVTPTDTFPPAAPQNLAAIAGAGVISLIWDANPESDLAGYLVLRGDAPGDTLQAITAQPVTETSYRDETVKPGTRYVYVVVAVDRAEPQNVSPQSNRAEETARQ